MWCRPSPLLPPLAALLYVAVLAWQAPHSVHHFFERDADKQHECALGAAAERSAGTTGPSIGLAPVAGSELSVPPVASDGPGRPVASVLGPRAPPSSAA